MGSAAPTQPLAAPHWQARCAAASFGQGQARVLPPAPAPVAQARTTEQHHPGAIHGRVFDRPQAPASAALQRRPAAPQWQAWYAGARLGQGPAKPPALLAIARAGMTVRWQFSPAAMALPWARMPRAVCLHGLAARLARLQNSAVPQTILTQMRSPSRSEFRLRRGLQQQALGWQ